MEDLTLLPDEKIVSLVCNKNQEIYKEIVTRYQKKLLKYAYYLVHNEEEAIDIVQESFIKAFVNLNGFDTNKKFSSWIYRIVHNEAMNLIKKNKRHISLEENEWTQYVAEEEETQEEKFSKKELINMINYCINKLPLTYRATIALFYLDEKSYNEISDILKLPIGTVGTRVNRGKALLKQYWKEYKYEK